MYVVSFIYYIKRGEYRGGTKVYVVSFIYYIKHTLYTMARISLNIDEHILQQFDSMWKAEGWESRQEAIVFLMKQALARGFISKEKSELAKVIGSSVSSP